MAATANIEDVYDELQEFADTLWDLYQSMDTDPASLDKALSMYNTLENVYLEPIRREIYQMDTRALAGATAKLNQSTDGINKTINYIANVIQTTNQLDQYVKVFDSIITIAAKAAAAVA